MLCKQKSLNHSLASELGLSVVKIIFELPKLVVRSLESLVYFEKVPLVKYPSFKYCTNKKCI